jgi:hypothetical protein
MVRTKELLYGTEGNLESNEFPKEEGEEERFSFADGLNY